ncbi:hypothetical protein BDQ17DRAFT_1385008 [Cyathus striatus]|nr:hypothetical protein BDQ17DRAFT_1385008 [Cyathus striatus]
MRLWDKAFEGMLKALPQGYRWRQRVRSVSLKPGKTVICIVISTNKNEKDIARAQDMDMIKKVHNILQTRLPPGWFRPAR